MTATIDPLHPCIHVAEETFEFIEIDLELAEVVVVKGLCALCGRYYEIERKRDND